MFQIVVEGVRGTGVSGGVAIDDVVLSNGACPPPGVCDFQGSLCGWTNIEAGDQADWLRGRGTSPLPSTGPHVDHTMGSSQGGVYMMQHKGRMILAKFINNTLRGSESV